MARTFSTKGLLAAALGATISLGACAADAPKLSTADFQGCAKPVWPKEALRKEQTGTVTLAFLIGTDGNVADAKITRSSGFPLLDDAAVAGLRSCRFKPGMVDGKPVSAWQQMQYVWTLDGPSSLKPDLAAVNQYRDAALAGDADALYQLAKAYSNGEANQAVTLGQFRTVLDHSLPEAQYLLGLRLAIGHSAPSNQIEAAVWYHKAAEAGHVRAQVETGYRYERGNGVAQDYAQAMDWYLKAAGQGDHQAENNIGLLHAYGRGVPLDRAVAAEWYRKAAEGGHAWGQANLGMFYLYGRGVEKDLPLAQQWLERAAAQHNPAAERDLSTMYLRGEGVFHSDEEGALYLRRAAQDGDTASQIRWGLVLTYGLLGEKADPVQGLVFQRIAAKTGNATAQNNIGYAFEIGSGVAQDYAAARDWYTRAVAQGNGNAQAALGHMYEQGKGMAKDLSKAASLYQASAAQNNPDGLYRLATLTEAGRAVPQSASDAVDLYRRSAELNFLSAMRRLATAYEKGELGLKPDAAQAQQWREKAEQRAAAPRFVFR
ncbi:TonB family protein [Duganella sp. HH101]|uniref:TonB family protein n=1 Tax=Duganella sp. HH101 TaxID=1781066 RepID=UPI00087364A0|nr:TonB family protein [Duganella sp. HH101]OFA05522.1 putative beta-lactamase HcpD precursor [Duganella sp. HH101]